MRQPSWKFGLVAGAWVFALLALVPNLVSRDILDRLPGFLPRNQIVLGLDLQGGSHLLLEVEAEAVIKDRLEQLVGEVRSALRTARIGYRGLGIQDRSVVLQLTEPARLEEALAELGKLNPLLPAAGFGAGTVRELVIEGERDGRIRLALSERARDDRVSAAVAQSLEVVRRRIDELGTREASIQRQGADRILVQVPGVRDPEAIKRLLGKTARLTFHMVELGVDPAEVRAGRGPAGLMVVESADRVGPREYVLHRQVELSGESLVDAQATFQNNEPVVSFRFDSQGARKFARITQENVGKLFAIVLDDKVISAPRIREPILGGSGIISGSFTPESANELAVLLRAGALPAPLKVIEERTVGPDLGADSIRAGTIAVVVASVLVVCYMMIYYGIFGLFANVALLLNVILILDLMTLLGATLTLPGIAGIVLTIGQAVDSNVLIYERIREEARAGRTPLAAIDAGFGEATRTIVDANLTTLIAAAALFYFGSGPVKGFAVTLGFGILANMFTAVTFTRVMVELWYRRVRPAAIPL
ncbi:MAG: protein translocase subunit SecD [Geminicoccaceae bacterium]|nr:protein translocase subunit SecD [Geminicoccaceae bacterium]MCS7268868.1 protein translocase subunit SecD [Geminicoccaceae bacterium]MCX7630393.1 protein translocase subunit SecD [Geminicoccaceae bacterium]MDW8125245.1 protein translocase subunit SecD [Geminicoccaceae bacterium]MDW8341002.1 protein translocase subunit SecD [Geminicoccaceae bacterium]